MKQRDHLICIASVILAIVFFVIAGTRLDSINTDRKDLKLVLDTPENIPPSLAFASAATGAFRGLLVDALWLHAENLKQDKKFFDAKQVAEWITALQPRFGSVWDFQAWNLAYNISVAIPATQPQERWRWVQNGYKLLRDEGIPLNPKNILLYRTLALIFQHKVGGVTDDAHNYYKVRLAMDMEQLLGATPDNAYFDALVAAPNDIDYYFNNPEYKPYFDNIVQADKLFKNKKDFVPNFMSLRENPAKFAPSVRQAFQEFKNTDLYPSFNTFVNAYMLKDEWKFTPELMIQLNQKFGPKDFNDPNIRYPLDYRNPDVHAIYWAYRGLQIASRPDRYSVDESNTDRIIVHSLQNLYKRGKYYVYRLPDPPVPQGTDPNDVPINKRIALYPRKDVRMFDIYNDFWITVNEKYMDLLESTAESIGIGHRNLLKDAILSFYQSGYKRKAADVYEYMRNRYPRKEFDVPLDEFLKAKLKDELEIIGLSDARALIHEALVETYFRYSMGDNDATVARENFAIQVYKTYQGMHLDEMERVGLPELGLLRYLAIIDFLSDPLYPDSLKESLMNQIEIQKPELYQELIKQQGRIEQSMQQSQQK